MQEPISRSCVTAGIALVSAGMVTVAPVTVPPPASAVLPGLALTTSYSDLFANTMDNLQNIGASVDWSAISQVFSALFTNPSAVIDAVSNLTLAVDTDITSLPMTVSVQLSPAFELLIAGLASQVATLDAAYGVIADLGNPETAFTALFNAPATVLDAYLNGQYNLTLLGGIITVPVYHGILAPEQNLQVELDLSRLLDVLGLGNLDLSNVNFDDLIEQIRLGTLTVDGLLSGLGISDEGLGDLLKSGSNVTDLGGLLNFLGLGDFGLGRYTLPVILSELGLDPEFYRSLDLNLELDNLPFVDLLSVFGINAEIPLGVGRLLLDLGNGSLADEQLGSLLSDVGLLTHVLSGLNATIASVFDPIPLIGPLLTSFATGLLGPDDLEAVLNNFAVGDLFGDLRIDETVSSVLETLGGAALSIGNLTVGGILKDLGFADSTGELTLNDLLGGLGGGLLGLHITGLLNGLDVGDLISVLGLANLPLDFGDVLGDWASPNLGELLDDLVQGQVNLAGASVGSFGGMITELFVSMPQQVLAMLGW